MTTQNKNGQEKEKITALYCRLSVDDDKKDMESSSITNQKQILLDYAKKHGYLHPVFFVDDGISGTTFQRPDFQRMQRMAENGEVGTIIVKDVSRFGREQVEMGRIDLLHRCLLGHGVPAYGTRDGACNHRELHVCLVFIYRTNAQGLR